MKNNNKLILIISLISIIIFGFYFVSNKQPVSKPGIKSVDTFEVPKEIIKTSPVSDKAKEIVNENKQKVTLEALGSKYTINIKNNDSVFNAMNILQNDKNYDFNFKFKEYPSLGILIEEINGVKSGNGKYLIYYVNGKEASVGVSNYILKEGDSILWKQE